MRPMSWGRADLGTNSPWRNGVRETPEPQNKRGGGVYVCVCVCVCIYIYIYSFIQILSLYIYIYIVVVARGLCRQGGRDRQRQGGRAEVDGGE